MAETAKFNGGTYPAEYEKLWKDAAKKDCFESVWHWVRWQANLRIKEQQKETGNVLDRIHKIDQALDALSKRLDGLEAGRK